MAAPSLVSVTQISAGWDSHAVGAQATASFSVTAGNFLVVVAAAENSNVVLATPVGGSLTWTLLDNIIGGTNSARTASWSATAASTTSITVSITSSGATGAWGFAVFQFSSSNGVGAHASVNGASGAPSQAITTTQANSAVVFLNADWAAVDGTTRTWRTINSITPTVGNGLEKVYFRNAASYTVYVGLWNDVGATGAKTTGLSAPVGQTYSIVAVEAKGSTSSAPAAKLIAVNRAVMRASLW
jgi:hypothetical protein